MNRYFILILLLLFILSLFSNSNDIILLIQQSSLSSKTNPNNFQHCYFVQAIYHNNNSIKPHHTRIKKNDTIDRYFFKSSLFRNKQRCRQNFDQSIVGSSSSDIISFICNSFPIHHHRRIRNEHETLQSSKNKIIHNSYQFSSSSSLWSSVLSSSDSENQQQLQEMQPQYSLSSIQDDDETNIDISLEEEKIEVIKEPYKKETFRERYNNYLPEWLLYKCDMNQYIYPTYIQQMTLDLIYNNIQSKNLVIQSETGSGKTLAYLLPCLASINSKRSTIQALIIVPTRELGLQVAKIAKRLVSSSSSSSNINMEYDNDNEDLEDNDYSDETNGSKDDDVDKQDIIQNNIGSSYNKKIMIMNVLEGSTNKRQRAWAWADPPHIVIGTPIELCQMIQYGGLKRYNSIKYIIVDEIDACLSQSNNMNTIETSSISSASITNTPLHTLLSKYLSPTFDDGTTNDDDELSKYQSNNNNQNNKRPLNQERTTIFCSATIPQVRYFIKQCQQNKWMLNEPQFLSSSKRQQDDSDMTTIDNNNNIIPQQVEHAYTVCITYEQKLNALKQMIRQLYCNSIMEKKEKGPAEQESHDADNNINKEIKMLIFMNDQNSMEVLAQELVLYMNKNINKWKNNDDSSSVNKQQKQQHAILFKETTTSKSIDNNNNISTIVSVLRFDDSISQRAIALDAFRGINNRNNNIRSFSIRKDINNHQSYDLISNTNNKILMRILFANDLATRGLDIIDITHVIHYDIPNDVNTYIHRSGRTGRYGRYGKVISIITSNEEFLIRRYGNTIQHPLQCIARQQQKLKK